MVLMPFHAFISTWGGSTVGPYQVWKVWKEILLVALVIISIYAAYRDKAFFRKVVGSPWARVVLLYIVMHLVAIMFSNKDLDALAYGLAINLRIVGFFFVSFVLFSFIKLSNKQLLKILFIPCGIVIGFGLLQLFFLPNSFLSHFGYQKNVTIAPSNTIDDQPDQIRIMSTLRGPNPLGAYLVLPGILLVSVVLSYAPALRYKWNQANMAKCGVAATGLLIVLYGSQARAAWIGFIISIAMLFMLSLSKKWRVYVVGVGVFLSISLGLIGYQVRQTSFVQNSILHNNPATGGEVTSNDAHIAAAKEGFGDVVSRPLVGCGPGCAGPASFYNKNGPRLAENYYIQIAQEVGLIGLGLFLAFIALIGLELFKLRDNYVALGLLASLIGLSFANLLLHVWADDSLAYVWWGLAGAVIAMGAVSPKSLSEEALNIN